MRQVLDLEQSDSRGFERAVSDPPRLMNIGPTSQHAVRNWIFVTGMIRSGTTFLGTVLSHPFSVDYVHEPFNGAYTLPDRVALLPRYVRPGDTSFSVRRYRCHVSHLFEYKIGMWTSSYDEDPIRRKVLKKVFGSRGPFYLRLAKLNPFHQHAVIKDPMAGLTTEFLYREFGVKPVVIVRHPVSLAASLKRLEWFPETYDFELQPDLIEDYLREDIDFLNRTWPNRMLESMVHWRLLHRVLLKQAEQHGDWTIITHEELSARPLDVFRRLYSELDLPWSQTVASKVKKLTRNEGKANASEGRVQDFERDSSSIFETRRDSVPRNVRKEIYEITADVALQIYDRDTYAL